MFLKIFLIWSSGGPFVQRSKTICAIFEEGIMGNIHVKLYEIWTSGLGDVIKDISYLELWRPFCTEYSIAEPFVQFW